MSCSKRPRSALVEDLTNAKVRHEAGMTDKHRLCQAGDVDEEEEEIRATQDLLLDLWNGEPDASEWSSQRIYSADVDIASESDDEGSDSVDSRRESPASGSPVADVNPVPDVVDLITDSDDDAGPKSVTCAEPSKSRVPRQLTLMGYPIQQRERPAAAPPTRTHREQRRRRTAPESDVPTPASSPAPRPSDLAAVTPRPPASASCPFYKRVPDTPFIVDGFQYAHPSLSRHYLLTHFHADHYGGLTKKFQCGTIYCTRPTAALVQARLRVPARRIVVLPMHRPTIVCGGVEVTPLDANHCPGAAMFLFRTPSGKQMLHVGDFRWHPRMQRYKPLRSVAAGAGALARLDALFLDTTYANARVALPSQDAAVAAAKAIVQRYLGDKRVLVLFGAYTIGKERLYMELAKEFEEKVFVDAARFRTLQQLRWPAEWMRLLTTDPSRARFHVVSMRALRLGALEQQLAKERRGTSRAAWARRAAVRADALRRAKGSTGANDPGLAQDTLPGPFHSIVALKPTGWVCQGGTRATEIHESAAPLDVREGVVENRREARVVEHIRVAGGDVVPVQRQERKGGARLHLDGSETESLRGGVTLFGVPYSEHSSFDELVECVSWLDPVRIIPTVNCRTASAAQATVQAIRAEAERRGLDATALDRNAPQSQRDETPEPPPVVGESVCAGDAEWSITQEFMDV